MFQMKKSSSKMSGTKLGNKTEKLYHVNEGLGVKALLYKNQDNDEVLTNTTEIPTKSSSVKKIRDKHKQTKYLVEHQSSDQEIRKTDEFVQRNKSPSHGVYKRALYKVEDLNLNNKVIHSKHKTSTSDPSQDIVSVLTNNINFSNDVIKDRSPHTLPFLISNTDLYKINIKKNRKKKQPKGKKVYAKKHMPCHLTPIDDVIKKEVDKETEPPLLGVSTSHEKLKLMPIAKESVLAIDQGLDKDKIIPVSRTNHAWDEHVLASISKSTAELIIKNFTGNSNHQEKLRTFLRKRSGECNFFAENDVPLTEKPSLNGKEEGKGQTQETKKFSAEIFFTSLGNKKEKKQFQNVLQNSYPEPPNVWAKNQGQKVSCVRAEKGLRKWVGYPREVEVNLCLLFKVFFGLDVLDRKFYICPGFRTINAP